MPQRRRSVVNYCLRRAAEAEQLAAMAEDDGTNARYGQLARAWRRLARNAEFRGKLTALIRELTDPTAREEQRAAR
jgi:hypothetical protein